MHYVARIGFVLYDWEAVAVEVGRGVVFAPVLWASSPSLLLVCAVGCGLWSSGLVGCDPVFGTCGEGCCSIEGCEGTRSAGEGLALIALEAAQSVDETWTGRRAGVSFGLLLGNALENEGGESRLLRQARAGGASLLLGQAHAAGARPCTCCDGI